MLRAVKVQLAKPKLHNPYYNIDEATSRFNFIDPQFRPDLQDRSGRRCDDIQQREAISQLMRGHYNMHTKIPIDGGMF